MERTGGFIRLRGERSCIEVQPIGTAPRGGTILRKCHGGGAAYQVYEMPGSTTLSVYDPRFSATMAQRTACRDAAATMIALLQTFPASRLSRGRAARALSRTQYT